MEKNGTLASPAMARARSVLPVPGEPISSTPLGMRPPSFWNFCGSRRNSMISCSSSLASSTPATSLNVTFFCCVECRRGAALAEAKRLVAAALHLAQHEDPEHDHNDEGRCLHQDGDPTRGALALIVDRDLIVVKEGVDFGIVGRELRGESDRILHVVAVNVGPVMVTSLTSLSCTLLTKSVSEIGTSFFAVPDLTTTNSIPARTSSTAQNNNDFKLELTKPPHHLRPVLL